MNPPQLKLNTDPIPGGGWPTVSQRLLLRAALLDGPAAVEAWRQWQQVETLGALDQASWKMLPLAYRNLSEGGYRDPLVDQAKAVHRHYWARNQKLFQQAAEFLDEVRPLNIPFLVLKGAALAPLYYRDAGARPMEDFDVLVPAENYYEVANHLLTHGWRGIKYSVFDIFNLDLEPSFPLERDDGFQIDLHGHVLHADCLKGADDPFWAMARPLMLKDRATLTLCPEDHLLHAISHGLRWNYVPPFRWMADVWQILKVSGGDFDWQRLVEQARFHRNHLKIARGLEGMRVVVPLPVPDWVIEQLRAIPATLNMRIDFACDMSRQPMMLAARLGCIRQELKRSDLDASWLARMSSLRLYLMESLHVKSSLLIPFAIAIGLMRNLWQRFKFVASHYPRLHFLVHAGRSVLFVWRKLVGSFRRRAASS